MCVYLCINAFCLHLFPGSVRCLFVFIDLYSVSLFLSRLVWSVSCRVVFVLVWTACFPVQSPLAHWAQCEMKQSQWGWTHTAAHPACPCVSVVFLLTTPMLLLIQFRTINQALSAVPLLLSLTSIFVIYLFLLHLLSPPLVFLSRAAKCREYQGLGGWRVKQASLCFMLSPLNIFSFKSSVFSICLLIFLKSSPSLCMQCFFRCYFKGSLLSNDGKLCKVKWCHCFSLTNSIMRVSSSLPPADYCFAYVI